VSRGRFVALEGVDGSGKTTHAALLADVLRADGLEVVLAREPGATALGERVRALLLHEGGAIAPAAEALLFAAARAQLVAEVVGPALAAGAWVVCDRFVDSSLAYQGGGRSLGVEAIRAINEFGTGGLRPDRTLLLRVDPAVGRARRGDRLTGLDRLEREDEPFFARIAAAYDELAAAEPERFVVLDGSRTPGEVLAQALSALEAQPS
jgi:dTMP kinase